MPIFSAQDLLSKGVISQGAYQVIGGRDVVIPDDPYANWYTAQTAGISRDDYLNHLKAGVEERSGMDFESYMTQVRANTKIIPEAVILESLESYSAVNSNLATNNTNIVENTCPTGKCNVVTTPITTTNIKQPTIETYKSTVELTNKITDPTVLTPQTFIEKISEVPSNKRSWMPLVLAGGALVGLALLFKNDSKQKESPIKTYST